MMLTAGGGQRAAAAAAAAMASSSPSCSAAAAAAAARLTASRRTTTRASAAAGEAAAAAAEAANGVDATGERAASGAAASTSGRGGRHHRRRLYQPPPYHTAGDAGAPAAAAAAAASSAPSSSSAGKSPMTPALYGYLLQHTREHPLLAQLRAETATMRGGHMQVAPEQGALLALLVELLGARRCLEVGVFTGYSALAVALALPDDDDEDDDGEDEEDEDEIEEGKQQRRRRRGSSGTSGSELVAVDRDAAAMAVARRYWRLAGVDRKVTPLLGPALPALEALLRERGPGSFDLAFIDADKRAYAAYFELCVRLVRPGGLVAVDNTLFYGRVLNPDPEQDKAAAALAAFNAALVQDARVSVAQLPVGDGMALCRVR